jgi:uncharacterized protein YybS (DUF2232 family)
MSDGRPSDSTAAAVLAALRKPELAVGAGASVLLFLTIGLIPGLGLLLGMFSPVPLFYLYYRRGRVFGLTAAGVSLGMVLVVYSAMGSPAGSLAYLEYCLLAAALAETSRMGLTPGKVIGGAALAVILFGLVLFYSSGPGEPDGVDMDTRELLEQQVRASIELYRPLLEAPPSSPGPGEIEPGRPLDETASSPFGDDTIERLVKFLASIFPGLAVIGAVMMAWINFLVGRALVRRSGTPWPPALSDLKTWSAPDLLVWVLLAAGFAVFVMDGGIATAAVNVLMVAGLAYFFQGLAVAAFWMHKKSFPPTVRGVIYFLILAQQYLALIVAAVGLIDLWADFRKLKAAEPGDTR